ncbi:hypothetical protein PENSTE_c031G02470 [Penicillium steckii]|uniref:Fe2OG dioxygenase domain-containing protein n=1 Tax=Penicillium steckii TaxID=303698 RepID=A0A1V6SMR6_9EURO|nr:hypothetical protein PENSTE_c031G02470 [Penicillium steckii]
MAASNPENTNDTNGITNFEPKLARLPRTSTPQEILTILLRDGGLILEQIADHEDINKAVEEIQPHLLGQARHNGVTMPKESKQISGLAGKSRTFATKLLANPLYQEVSNLLLAKTTTTYYGKQKQTSVSKPQVTNTMAFWIGPGAQAQGLHRDDQCHHTRHPAKYETDLGIMFAATKSHKANGATRVVPGSNKWDDHRKPRLDEATSAELDKGDALMWLGSTYHGAGQNTTSDEYRLLFAGFMTPGWCRQDENQYLAYSFEDIEDYPEDIQKLLGYYVSRPYGGFVEQMEPLEFLKCKGDWTKWQPGDLV